MSEHARERLFWYLTLILCAASPAGLIGFQKLQLSFEPFRQAIFALVVLLPVTLSIPILIELIVALLTGRPLRLGVKNPTTQLDEQVPRPLEEVRSEALARLAQLGFIAAPSEDGSTIIFIKPKQKQVHHFMDHEFAGRLICSPDAYGTRVQAELTFKDTLVVDTGETKNLTKLCRQICGIEAAEESANMPFIVPVAFTHALITVVLGIVANFRPVANAWVVVAGGMGVLMNISAVVQLRKNPRRHFGLRISIASLFLTTLPFLSLVTKLAAK